MVDATRRKKLADAEDDEDIEETMRLLHSWKIGELTDKELIDGLHESMHTNFDDEDTANT